MRNFITLPNGDMLKKNAITAVRMMDADLAYNCPNRVIVDFVSGMNGNSIVIECDSPTQMKQRACAIKDKLRTA